MEFLAIAFLIIEFGILEMFSINVDITNNTLVLHNSYRSQELASDMLYMVSL